MTFAILSEQVPTCYNFGWADPESVLMAKQRSDWIVSLFVQPNDTIAEIWEGRRIGIEGALDGLSMRLIHYYK